MFNSLQELEVDSLISEEDQEERTLPFMKSLMCITCCYKERTSLANVSTEANLTFVFCFLSYFRSNISFPNLKIKTKDSLKWWSDDIAFNTDVNQNHR